MQKVMITGGSGLIGRQLTEILVAGGYKVHWLSRSKKQVPGVAVFLWDIDKEFIEESAFNEVDVIIHLAGEGIADKRWTASRKKMIIESRTRSTEFLIKKLREIPNKVTSVICASAIGFYAANTNSIITEENNSGEGFLSESVSIWENATKKFTELPIKLLTLRIGIVLSKNGGAYKELIQTKSLGVLPLMGNGKQIYSWIHIEDVCRIILFLLQNNLSGIYNAVAPAPVSQKHLMRTVKKYSKGFQIIIPVPAFGLKLVLGEMSNAVLNSQTISGEKILKAGYKFKFPDIDSAIKDLEMSKGREA